MRNSNNSLIIQVILENAVYLNPLTGEYFTKNDLTILDPQLYISFHYQAFKICICNRGCRHEQFFPKIMQDHDTII